MADKIEHPAEKSLAEHAHNYQFLRTDKVNIAYDRSPTWEYRDVYFCCVCLNYKRIATRRTVPCSESFSRENEIWSGYEVK